MATIEFIDTPEQLLDAVLEGIDSVSIREWVQRQRDVWIKYGATPILNDAKSDKVSRLQILIISEAIGL